MAYIKTNGQLHKQNADIIIKTPLPKTKHAMKNKDSNQAGKRITIRTKNETVYIKTEQVTHLTCDGYLSTVHCNDGVSIAVARLLKSFETFLNMHGFIRVNHNTIININYIEKSKRMEGHTLQLCGGQKITISRRKFSGVKVFLLRYYREQSIYV